MENGEKRRLNGGEDDDDEDEGNGSGLEAWERTYADERSLSHVKALMGKLECSGDSSLRNCLDLVHGHRNQIPSYDSHFKELILKHAPPPPAIADFAISNLVKMGFPQRAAEGSVAMWVDTHFFTPFSQILSSSVPVVPFDEVSLSLLNDPHLKLPKACFGCQQSLLISGNKPGHRVSCLKCKQRFCAWTVTFIFMRACTTALVVKV
ncbi:hypothetical protein FNV43_RR01755 [Rhamnella rubrinervis]|uniref:Uncharacterized protein n=1 Tax=Rhamnella rubrinervis TaxID=2594499 RepID=A0A8K0HS22_9ROSA|nr:hypothetical protein FNV43_RR01755 [Rhamnella rubrinervis]